MSRQIRALEDSLGVPLFERRIRALALTNEGRRLLRTVETVLGELQETTNRIRADANARHLTVTTTGGFASLWLIPRLSRFTTMHPDVDVRIQATYVSVPLDRGAADVAVRYARHDAVPADAVRLFGEVTLVCAPSLLKPPRRADAHGSFAAHTAASRPGTRHSRLGHVADGRRARRPQGRDVHALRQLRAADPGGPHGTGVGLRHQRLVEHPA